MVNDVGFVISKKDLALGPGTSLDHSRAIVQQSFTKVKKGQRNFLTQTSEGGWQVPLLISLSKALYTFTRPTPTTYILN